jgi:two-component system C4-dicarboxylate transport response regulator DctD
MTFDATDRPRFAVVEDDVFMAQLVADMLSVDGIEPVVFLLGEELLKSRDLLSFKTIILDLSLPDIDGFDLMDRLAEKAVGSPVVLMSGHDEATLRAAKLYGNALGLQLRGVLSKPFNKDQFFQMLGL